MTHPPPPPGFYVATDPRDGEWPTIYLLDADQRWWSTADRLAAPDPRADGYTLTPLSAVLDGARLRSALEAAADWFLGPDGMGASELFDYVAERFYRETGVMRPGKDAPGAFGPSHEERRERFRQWCAENEERVRKLIRQALAATERPAGVGDTAQRWRLHVTFKGLSFIVLDVNHRDRLWPHHVERILDWYAKEYAIEREHLTAVVLDSVDATAAIQEPRHGR